MEGVQDDETQTTSTVWYAFVSKLFESESTMYLAMRSGVSIRMAMVYLTDVIGKH